MFNFTLISKKNFLNFLKKVNYILINIFNNFKFSNLKRLTKLFFIDKRVIFTLIIIFFSVFVHLSTPAFYKDSWVKGIVKNQFEKEFEFEIEFSDKLNYAIFPIPHFRFKDVKFTSSEGDLAEIELIKVYLTFSKFLDKNKMNIQNVIIKKAKFNLYKNDLKNLFNFYDKKINEKKITIFDSKIFLKDSVDDTYSIISIDKSQSFYDNFEVINNLIVDGEIFNNSFKLKLKNDFVEKKSDLDLVFDKLNKRYVNIIDFKKKEGRLSYLNSRKRYDTFYLFDKDVLSFNSEEKTNDNFFYSGKLKFSPFSSYLQVNLKTINLKKLLGNESLFLEILKSNIFDNENLNFNIEVKSKNISDHRKLKNLNLNINYENQSLNFNQSNFILEDILKINLIDSQFINKKKQYFLGSFEIAIDDHSRLYKFFQTKKKYRKKISSIFITIKYDFLRNDLILEELIIDDKKNENILNFIRRFNQDNEVIENKVDLRNFFNSFIVEL
tara:strand:+ start:805 stop:2292 length:1488 start_codon:yes stop_codon:yes gene_type:complete